MKVRVLTGFCLFAAIVTIVSCSSGLGNNLPGDNDTAVVQASTNLPVGIDIGFTPSQPIEEGVVAGVLVPAVGSFGPREVVLLAFTTAAAATENDGMGTSLSRDAVTDTNGEKDVFVAAVCAEDIDTTAFSQSLAGKFRHPRCTTCHSMQAADTNAFVSAEAAYGEAHAGPPPGPTFPALDEATCVPCHINSTTFPVPTWKAPDASFDMRTDTVAELAVRAQNIPTGDLEHFVTDLRVLWALDSGILPQVGGRNGRADDDHDGVDEPTDRDGTPRTVPGGSAAFLQEIEDWIDGGRVISCTSAIKDVTLVSRTSGDAAGNGASSAPKVLFVPNGSFSAPGTVGTLYVVYQSEASDLAGTDGNSASDVFRTAVALNSDAAGNLDLVVGSTVLCSTPNGTNSGDAASSNPSIGGSNGELVAFESLASDLAAFTDNNGAAHDVFVRNITGNTTTLVSHAAGAAAAGGNGASEAPSIDVSGVTVAFESDASDLIAGDSNGVRDVFYSQIDTAAPFTHVRASVTSTGTQGSGGASRNAGIYFSGSRALVVFESDKSDLAASLGAATNVYLFDSNSGATTLLNQIIAPTRTAVGDGAARNPVIGPDGAVVAFESDASNIDTLRDDENGVTDVFLIETSRVLAGSVLPYRFSLTTAEAADANGASTMPQFGTFASASDSYQVGFATYATAATNLGTSDTTNLMVAFLDETAGVLADFTSDVSSGTVPFAVSFTDTSSGGPTAWAWDFDGDDVVDSTEQNPTFTYTTPGTFTVELVASNANTTSTKTATITATAPPVTASFTVSPDPATGSAPFDVAFDASASVNAVSYSWDFGDGNSGTGVTTSHTYTSGGVFTITLTATGEFGDNDTATDTATVAGDVTASFTISSSSQYTDASITLDASGSTGDAPLTYEWDFDNDFGSVEATGVNPTVNVGAEFPTSSTTAYTIRLRVTASGGGSGITSDTFTAVAASESVVLTSVNDTTIYEGGLSAGASGDPLIDNGNGAGTSMVAGRPSGVSAAGVEAFSRRALVRFDFSSLPNLNTVNSASLVLTSDQPVDTGSRTVRLNRLTSAWTEGSESGVAGIGADAAGGGATWQNRTTPSTAWTSNGGDISGTQSASTTVSGFVVFPAVQTHTFTSAQMATDVFNWASGMQGNFGWLIRGNESVANTAKRFFTHEHSVAGERPRLTVNYRRALP